MDKQFLENYGTIVSLVSLSLVICIYIITGCLVKISRNLESIKNELVPPENEVDPAPEENVKE